MGKLQINISEYLESDENSALMQICDSIKEGMKSVNSPRDVEGVKGEIMDWCHTIGKRIKKKNGGVEGMNEEAEKQSMEVSKAIRDALGSMSERGKERLAENLVMIICGENVPEAISGKILEEIKYAAMREDLLM